jgi:hypothetical protein
MPNREGKSITKVVPLLAPATVTDDVRTASLDVQGWDSVLIVVQNGAVTAAAPIATNNFAITLLHKDTAPATLAGYVAVPATARKGAFANLDNDNDAAGVQTVAYTGDLRYLHVFIDETGTASAGIAAYAILQKSAQEPGEDRTVTPGAAPS